MLNKRVMTILFGLLLLFNFDLSYGQAQNKQYNPQYNPISLVKRLSYENFRNIKLLRTAILNYGGGEAEMQKLIDQYADASALYFQDNVTEAANKYSENEKEIFKVAKKIADGYRKDSTMFLHSGIKRNIKITLEREVGGSERNHVMDKYLDNAKFSLKRANSIYDDFKYVNQEKPTSSYRLITSIYYYRMAKSNLFMMYRAHVESLRLDKDGKKDKEMKNNMMDKLLKEDYKADFKKDMQDNKNKIFTSMEKKI